MTLEGKLSNNVAPIQSLTLDDHYLVAGSRDRNVRVSLFIWTVTKYHTCTVKIDIRYVYIVGVLLNTFVH